jgi:Fic-DOC domain mobile mystery protein B
MTDPLFEADDEANTPLTPEGRQGLIPTYITTRAELNEAEQENIAEANRWAFSRKRGDVVDVDFLMALHRRMLRQVWRWAGTQRTTELNIGVPSHRIAVDLHTLVGDVRYWIDHQTFAADEIAVQTRKDYVRALQAADAHDIAPLLAFARS